MQVVYSGGSSTPTPSPRLQRKNHGGGGGGGGGMGGGGGGYGRPMMPGYVTGVPTVVQRSPRAKGRSGGDTEPGSLRDVIPAMTRPVAVVCFLLNVLVPGLGTLVSGLTVLCGSDVRPRGSSKRQAVTTNSGVAVLQFLLTFLLLLGWVWSLLWAVAFLAISEEYRRKPERRTEEAAVSSSSRPKQSPTQKRERSGKHNSSSQRCEPSPPSPSLAPQPPPAEHNNHSHQSTTSTTHQPPSHRNGLSTNAMGEPLATPPALLPASSEGGPPIIVLQEAPVSVNHTEATPCPSRTLMNARTRHEKLLQRRISANELSPFVLTHQKLEAIVIHDAPVSQQARAGRP